MGWQDYLPQGSNDPRSIGSRVGRKVGELNEWRKSIKDRWQKAENYRILKQQGKPIPLELEAFIAGERAKDVPAQVDPNATALPYNPLDPANPAKVAPISIATGSLLILHKNPNATPGRTA